MERLFIAVPVRLYDYGAIQNDFSPLLEGRWREAKTLHVTVAFLGDRFSPQTLIDRLNDIDFIFNPSTLNGLDYFAKSRVFVATSHNPSLQDLYSQIQKPLDLDNLILTPHVTLMRVKKVLASDLFFNRLKVPPPHPLGALEPCIRLYRSTLLSEGAVYEVIREWNIRP